MPQIAFKTPTMQVCMSTTSYCCTHASGAPLQANNRPASSAVSAMHGNLLKRASASSGTMHAWAPENEAPAQIAEAMYVGGIIMQLNNNGATGGMTNSVQVGNVPREDSAGSNLPLCG
jgi:hypothetical protein